MAEPRRIGDLLGALAPHHPTRWFIWSDYRGGWLSQKQNGYTNRLYFAAKFTDAEARAIVTKGPPAEKLIRFPVPDSETDDAPA